MNKCVYKADCWYLKNHKSLCPCCLFKDYKAMINESLSLGDRSILHIAYMRDLLPPTESAWVEKNLIALDESLLSRVACSVVKDAFKHPMIIEDGYLVLDGVKYSKETLLENLK